MSELSKKVLPKDLTSYDFFKTLAVLLMIVDHVGYYFYPEENWFRVIGRLCVPIWFFFIGYARTRDITPSLWVGGSILVVANMVAGMYVFPLNIMFTMVFVRLAIDPVMKHVLRGKHELWSVCTVLFFLIVPASMVTEYGTQSIIMAMYGYMIRHRHERKEIESVFFPFSVFAFFSFVFIQAFMFVFVGAQLWALQIGILVVMLALYRFKPVTLPKVTAVLPRPAVWLLQVGGRRTLEIYVIHLLLFKTMAVFYGHYHILEWSWSNM